MDLGVDIDAVDNVIRMWWLVTPYTNPPTTPPPQIGRTPVSIAFFEHNNDALRFLISRGANITKLLAVWDFPFMFPLPTHNPSP